MVFFFFLVPWSTWVNWNGRVRTKSNTNWTVWATATAAKSTRTGRRPACCTCCSPSAARRRSKWYRTCPITTGRSPNRSTYGKSTRWGGRFATSGTWACSRSACTRPTGSRPPTCAASPTRFACSSWSTPGCRRTRNTKPCRPLGTRYSCCEYNIFDATSLLQFDFFCFFQSSNIAKGAPVLSPMIWRRR